MSDEIEMRAVVVARRLASEGRLSNDRDSAVREIAATIATAMEEVCAEAFERADRLSQDNTQIAHARGELRETVDMLREQDDKWRRSFDAVGIERNRLRLALVTIFEDLCDETYMDGRAPCGCCRSHNATAARVLELDSVSTPSPRKPKE